MEFLGVIDEPITQKTDCTINKIGGFPDFVKQSNDAVRCESCQKPLILLCQLYSPISTFNGHRYLYIFCCTSRNDACKNRIKSYRHMQTANEEHLLESGDQMSPQDDWGCCANDWGATANEWGFGAKEWVSVDTVNKEEIMQSIQEDESTKNQADKSEEVLTSGLGALQLTAPHYKPHYVNVIDASHVKYHDVEDAAAERLLQEYVKREGVQLSQLTSERPGSSKCKEEYEQSYSEAPQKIFHRFMKSVRRCPEQVVRYCYGGSPIPCVAVTSAPPPCEACSSPRQFELQLMPSLLNHLVPIGFSDSNPVDWSTVLVYTCSANCTGSGADQHTFTHPEFCLILQEPDSEMYDNLSSLT